MADMQINPKIYGEKELNPADAVTGATKELSPEPAQVPMASGLQGLSAVSEGAGVLKEANRERAGTLASMGAAMTQWPGTHAVEWATGPSFDVEPGFKSAEFLKHVPIALSMEDEQFLLNTKSNAEAQHKLENLQARNAAMQAMGDSPIAAGIVSLADPSMFAVDFFAGGAGHLGSLARLGEMTTVVNGVRTVTQSTLAPRLATGAATFGMAYGVGKAAQQVEPTSDMAIVANSMLWAAGSAMLYKGGKWEPKDRELPSDHLTRLAEQVERGEGHAGGVRPTEGHPDYTGEVQTYSVPDPRNDGKMPLTEPAVPVGGEAGAKVKYGPSAAKDPNAIVDYVGVQKALGVSAEDAAAIVKDGRVVSVNSVADIAEHSVGVRNGATQIAEDAKAVYLPGDDKVFLVMDNIKPGDDVKGILLHEYGVHMNAERVLGTAKLGEMLNTLEVLALKGNKRAKAAFEAVPKDTALHLQREEALGYYVEMFHSKVGDNIVSRMYSAVKEKLRASGLASIKYTEADIMNLVRKAAKGGEQAKSHSFDSTFPYAWHGSPVRGIDKLDTAYMGSGEGNAAFGYGHYVTSEKGVALDYRNKESVKRGINPEEGGLYRVKLAGTKEDYLDLDGRVQSDKVAAVLRSMGVRDGVTGKSAYEWLARKLGGQKEASEALYNEGVLGNRYATGRTRNTGDRSSNFVAFHNDVVDTAARYSRPSMQQQAKTVARTLGEKAEWSLSKALGSFSDEAGRISELLVDNPLNMSGDSVVSQTRAIRADLGVHQHHYEDLLRAQMAEQGMGTFKRILNPRKATAMQQDMEREVGMEMLRRHRLSLDGMPISHQGIPPHVKEMADALDGAAKQALGEMKRSGVKGADTIAETSGFFSRRWDISRIEGLESKLVGGGMAPAAAKQQITDLVSVAIQRATGWDAQLASDVSQSILDRARRKGYFEDNAFRRHEGLETAKEVRDIMTQAGVPPQRIQAVLDVLVAKADEEGKVSFLKNRIDMHMDESINLPDGSTASVADLIDMNMANTTQRYLDSVAAQAGMARKGLDSTGAIDNLRTKFLDSIPEMGKREEAAYLFDQTMNAIRGLPVGEKMNDLVRKMSAATQMMGLASSGLWQLSEYSSAMAKFGGIRTLGSLFRELPGARAMFMSADLKEAGHLRNVLARNATEDMRLRPFINRMEDNFDIPVSDAVQLSLMQSKQLVPYINGMKYIQGHQARMVGNLIVDTLQRGANGERKALDALARYGLEGHVVGGIRGDIAAHGMDTAKWADATWDAVRGPMTKMMDDAVLRSRTGEIPAFAQFSQVGKFLFTFRSFVLASHNKVLAGTLNRHGFSGMALLLAWQMPLTLAATAANNTLSGKKPMDDKKLVAAAFGQLGALGLFGELYGAISGTKQQFGSPGTIGIDRMYKLGNTAGAAAFGDGSAGKTGAAALSAIPLMSIMMPIKAIAESLKE